MQNFDPTLFKAEALTWLHTFWPALIILAIWSIFWKGVALWHAARKGHEAWFVALLVINTVGILEMIYLFLILKLKVAELLSKKK